MAKKRNPPRTVEVITKHQITPHMLRVTFGGASLEDFPANQDSAYVKLRMTEPAPDSDEKAMIRTYTVRHFDAAKKQLDVDFVLHDIDGPAARWASDCAPGDTIRIMGPGPKKLVDFTADWFLLAGDMSALPAISANIEGLPDTACGYAIIEIIDASDRQELAAPTGLDVHWLVNPHPESVNSLLLDTVRSIDWLDGEPSIWVAGEFTQTLEIRKYLKDERRVPRHALYASSYWQIGLTEDGHRVSKSATAN